jgi:hypothetical protein
MQQPLIAVPSEKDGEEEVRYFVDEEQADTALNARRRGSLLILMIGHGSSAFKDLEGIGEALRPSS